MGVVGEIANDKPLSSSLCSSCVRVRLLRLCIVMVDDLTGCGAALKKEFCLCVGCVRLLPRGLACDV